MEHVAKSEENSKTTTDVDNSGGSSNYPNFKQKEVEENCINKNERKPADFGNCHHEAAIFQKLTTTALSMEMQILKQKVFLERRFL